MPGFNAAQYKRLQHVLPRQCNYTAHVTKPRTGLYKGFSYDCARSTAHDTRPIQQAIAPPAPRWRAYTRPDALSRYQNHRHVGTLHRSTQPSIIIRYIRGQTMPAAAGQHLPCADRWQVLHPVHPLRGQPGGVSMLSTPGGWRSGTGSAIRAGILAPSIRRGGPAAGARRAARNHWRLPPRLFSGFRPIANKVSNSRSVPAGIVVTGSEIVVE